MDFYDQDNEGSFVPANLPIVPNPVEVYLVSQFLIETDRKENLMNAEVIRAMERLYEKYGQGASISVMGYVQRKEGWDLEILLQKNEVEDYLMHRYSMFDDDIWLKVLGTAAMSDLRREVFALTQTYLDGAVREVLEMERPDTSPMGDPLM